MYEILSCEGHFSNERLLLGMADLEFLKGGGRFVSKFSR